jgi:hypothetical protein
MSNISKIIAVVLVLVVGAGVYLFVSNDDGETSQINEQTEVVEDARDDAATNIEELEDAMYLSYPFMANLADVTESSTLQGVAFDGDSSGEAYATFADGSYALYAEFDNLPPLTEDLFYEGWVIGGAEGVVSTGVLEQVDGRFVNNFSSDQDLTDSTRYILTLEPNDGDPAPADHVVEGDFVANEL